MSTTFPNDLWHQNSFCCNERNLWKNTRFGKSWKTITELLSWCPSKTGPNLQIIDRLREMPDPQSRGFRAEISWTERSDTMPGIRHHRINGRDRAQAPAQRPFIQSQSYRQGPLERVKTVQRHRVLKCSELCALDCQYGPGCWTPKGQNRQPSDLSRHPSRRVIRMDVIKNPTLNSA